MNVNNNAKFTLRGLAEVMRRVLPTSTIVVFRRIALQ